MTDQPPEGRRAMKGMLNFLEKAGLVKQDTPPDAEPASQGSASAHQTAAPVQPANPVDKSSTKDAALPLSLDQIYSDAGVAQSLYPAERLLRLIDGLSAMDEATRLMAIKAMDAADESWSIEDPVRDATAKVQALAAHGQQLQASLQALQTESQARLAAIAARQAQVVGDIKKQISELEALVAREQTRAAQETANQEASLKAAQDQTVAALAAVGQTSQRLQALARQFGANAATSQE
jgi:hypothetical protein